MEIKELLETNPNAERVDAMGKEVNGKQHTLYLTKLEQKRFWFVIPNEVAKDLEDIVETKEIIKYLDLDPQNN